MEEKQMEYLHQDDLITEILKRLEALEKKIK